MARKITWGTPTRSKHYLFPRRALAAVNPSLLLGAGVLAIFLLLQLVGWRSALAPGSVTSSHAPIGARCQECHAPRQGASNLRCQRCHDPAGGGRLSNGAHVLFGSRDEKKAAAAADLACARCHVEHKGALNRLAVVDQLQCVSCHFSGFSSHPEFGLLRTKAIEVPGIKFGHRRHVEEVVKKYGGTPAASCVQCHEPIPRGRDFDGISFDRHCASCHTKEGSVGTMDPVAREDLMMPDAIRALSVSKDGFGRPEDFEENRGRVSKRIIPHRDAWVLFNMRKLWREVEPTGFLSERGALLARISQLLRRQSLATPLAGQNDATLRARQASLESEIKGIEARLAGLRSATPTQGSSRLDEILAAAAAARDEAAKRDAQSLSDQGRALKDGPLPEGLPKDAFEARRRELLSLLEALDTADPSQRLRVEDLRRRLLALSPGESGLDLLSRVRSQRVADLERVKDEIRLRKMGAEPPRPGLLLGQQRAIQKAIDETQQRLREISEGPTQSNLTAEQLQRKRESLEVLAAACLKCHILAKSRMASVAAARPVMVRAVFLHQPHLLHADCLHCHETILKSELSQDINFKGVESCRECHRPRAVRQDCQVCHRYHPPSQP